MANLSRRAGLAATMLLIAGCDSTSPHGVTPAQLARHIDSLSAKTGQFGSVILNYLELPPALGASPVPVTVSTTSGSHAWEGFMFKTYLPGVDSSYSFVAYSDYALTNVIAAELMFINGQVVPSAQLVSGDTLSLGGGSGTITGTLTSTEGACVRATGLHEIAIVTRTCQLATFSGSITWTWLSSPGVEYQSISVAPQSFNGVVMTLISY